MRRFPPWFSSFLPPIRRIPTLIPRIPILIPRIPIIPSLIPRIPTLITIIVSKKERQLLYKASLNKLSSYFSSMSQYFPFHSKNPNSSLISKIKTLNSVVSDRRKL